jgi:hypothetical protein
MSSVRSWPSSSGVAKTTDWMVPVTSRTSSGYRERVSSKRRMVDTNRSRSAFDRAAVAPASAGSSVFSSKANPVGTSRHGRSRPCPPPASSMKPSRASIRKW